MGRQGEERHEGTVMNVNKGVDAGMGHMSSQLMEKPIGPEHRMVEGAEAAEVGRASWQCHSREFKLLEALGVLGAQGRRRGLCRNSFGLLTFPPTTAMRYRLVSHLNICGTHCLVQDDRDHSSSCQSCPNPLSIFSPSNHPKEQTQPHSSFA